MALIDLLPSGVPLITVKPGELIFEQGERGDVMYVVAEGKVDIMIDGKIIDSAGPDSVVGEMALIDLNPRSASAIARTRCSLIPLDEQSFTMLVAKQPEFALTVMRVLVKRLRRMDSQL
jgi:CRP/FNR family cyclic AMP-dependent transcriptional regulator